MYDFIAADIIKEENGIIFLTNENKIFEEVYIRTREKEGWLYDIAAVKTLPETIKNDPLYDYWKIRQMSSQKFITRLRNKKNVNNILEIGCGNGWFTNKLAVHFPDSTIIGLDINQTELQLAAAAFKAKNTVWIYGDIMSNLFIENAFDIIVFNASIQYFSQINSLMNKALFYLKPAGEIHILDSPFYTEEKIITAKNATQQYYHSIDAAEMTVYYFHHSCKELHEFDYALLYKPSLFLKIKNKFLAQPYDPFPWIVIRK